ncbi:MAG TPA: hypothetical protein VGW75_07520 [Solirubrobacteraceae bacterium]|jgi:hypothetical protein|nr:hypothetical protein [Solirubrobacteraceae bacterium]
MFARSAALGVALAVVLVAAVPPAVAGAAGPRVRAMVVSRAGNVVAGVRQVRLDAFRYRRCRIPSGVPLGALHFLRMSYRARGECDSLYVYQVRGERERGTGGWVYKVGTRAGTASAVDPSGPFGNGRIRSGAEVVWFWCREANRCQRSLRIHGERRVRPGGRLRMRIRGYDDYGRSRVIRGAVVSVAGRRVRTNRRGLAYVRMPRRRGLYRMRASKRGLVPAFPVGIRVR